MPQRSNLFQRLAVLMHETLEPDWKVTESEMLLDRITGLRREVDIVAKKVVATHEVILSVECRDHNRAADILWVEAAAKKHEHLPTSKLVLWSRSGFTRPALEKAKALKIDAVSQAQATSPTWAKLARDLIGGSVHHVAPTYQPFVDMSMPDGSLKRFESVTDWKFFNSSGTEVGSIAAFIYQIANSPDTRSVLLDNAPPGSGSFWVHIDPPEPWFADVPEVARCRAHRIGVGIETHTENVPLKTASAVAGNLVMTLGSAAVQRGTIELVVEEDASGTTRLRTRIAPKEA